MFFLGHVISCPGEVGSGGGWVVIRYMAAITLFQGTNIVRLDTRVLSGINRKGIKKSRVCFSTSDATSELKVEKANV